MDACKNNTINNKTVTLRNRDTMEQVTLKIDELEDYINKNLVM